MNPTQNTKEGALSLHCYRMADRAQEVQRCQLHMKTLYWVVGPGSVEQNRDRVLSQ